MPRRQRAVHHGVLHTTTRFQQPPIVLRLHRIHLANLRETLDHRRVTQHRLPRLPAAKLQPNHNRARPSPSLIRPLKSPLTNTRGHEPLEIIGKARKLANRCRNRNDAIFQTTWLETILLNGSVAAGNTETDLIGNTVTVFD